MIAKITAKKFLGELPLTAEAYWHLRQPGRPLNKSFTLQELQQGLLEWRAQAEKAAHGAQPGKNVLIFSTLHYWISHATLLGLALAGLGQVVTLAYLPYGKWQKPLNRFDLRRQNAYAQDVLRQASPQVQAVSWLVTRSRMVDLPRDLKEAVEDISLRDTQYTLQVEDVSQESDLYQLRLARNNAAARAALSWMKSNRPDIVIIPNGSILEFGVVYRVARSLGIPVVTYEFGEQRQRMWLGKDVEVMRQQTDDLWSARGGHALSATQLDQVRQLFAARQKASLWENFSRRWQDVPSIGGQQLRAALNLDQRPIVLLATNVIGDSLTLGRQVFSESMTEWLKRTVQYFTGRTEVQLVVRIHPGELITKGPSVADVVGEALPEGLPAHIHLVPAAATVNTYDIVEIADLGLVYTTTVGLEMAMSGVPVIAIGNTHYRAKGFTLDPNSWESYFDLLDRVLSAPDKYRLSKIQVERAWEYAYRFFFEYPFPFPWHLVHLWTDVKEWPVGRVLDEEGQAQFGDTLRYLVGETVDWTR
ncbi:MAG TPA: hypothetical protein VI755_09240 [Anaerolineales bacterium]|nr:hypothetical protein [Anaerolineales bacterium]